MEKLLDFAGFRSQADRLKGRLREVRNEAETIRREIDRIGAAPANRADIILLVKRWVAGHREQYAADLHVTLRPFFVSAASTQAVPNDQMLTLAGASPMVGSHGDGLSPSALDRVLFGLLGDQMEKALLAAIEKMEFPNEGLPWSQRPAAQAKLDAKLVALVNEEEALLKAASEVGLMVE